MTRTIDVHCHYYPTDWLKFLEKNSNPKCVKTGPTSYLVYINDVICAHIDRAGHYDAEARIKDMDKAGLDVQIISQTIPGCEMLPKDLGTEWAKRNNDSLAEVCEKYPGRFYFLTSLQYKDIKASLKEIERCKKEYPDYVKGIQMFSNFDGRPVADPEFEDVFAAAEENNLPILMHPASPLTDEAMKMVRIPFQLFGYTMDTTMAIISLIFKGTFEKYPNLKIVHGHLGGMVPYMLRRLDDSFKGYGKEWGYEDLAKQPSEYYKSNIYADTCNFSVPSITLCYTVMGADHIVLGTDYAHRVGDPEGAIGNVKALDISDEEKDKILGKNVEKLFNV